MKRSWFALAASLLLELACGGNVHDEAEDVTTWESGSRLRARVRDAGDGATMFLGWQDTELGVPCGFFLADDGVERCLPLEDTGSIEFGYGDAACERRVAVMRMDECTRLPEYVTLSVPVRDSSECAYVVAPARWEASRFGDETTGAFHHLVKGACEPRRELVEGEAMFALERVDSGQFVAATESRYPLTDDLELSVLEAEDGARQSASLRDRKRDRPCYLSPVENGYRCISGTPAYASGAYYADAACSDELAYALPCGSPEFVERWNRGACGGFYTFHALGAAFDGTAYFRFETCDPETADWYDTHLPYEFGEDISATFPLVEVALVGSGRARAARVANTGYPIFRSPWRDATGEECTLHDIEGTTRCLPYSTGEQYGTDFADPECTQALISWSKTIDSCGHKKLAVALRHEGVTCNVDTYSLVALGEDWTGTVYTIGSGGACVPRVPFESEGFSLPAGPADPEMFAEVVDRVE